MKKLLVLVTNKNFERLNKSKISYSSHRDIKVEVDCSNYATKADVRKETSTDTPSPAKKSIQLT